MKKSASDDILSIAKTYDTQKTASLSLAVFCYLFYYRNSRLNTGMNTNNLIASLPVNETACVNSEITVLASAARTATTTSANIDNPFWRGGIFFLNVTVASGTGGLTLELQLVDPVSGASDIIFQAGSAKTATGLFVYQVYPTASLATDNGGSADTCLSRTFNIKIAHGDSSSYTYSVGASMQI